MDDSTSFSQRSWIEIDEYKFTQRSKTLIYAAIRLFDQSHHNVDVCLYENTRPKRNSLIDDYWIDVYACLLLTNLRFLMNLFSMSTINEWFWRHEFLFLLFLLMTMNIIVWNVFMRISLNHKRKWFETKQ